MHFSSKDPEEFSELAQFSSMLSNPSISITGSFPTDPDEIEQLILSKYWPEAVPDRQIITSLELIEKRAKVIVEAFLPNLSGKKFLDFGCGTGHCVKFAKETAEIAVGFDITKDEVWDAIDALLFLDFDKVKENGPYDHIMLYDVFDHIPEEDVEEAMVRIAELSHEDTVIKIRCQPWTGIHGGHVYENLNRAYAHLFLSDEQLKRYQTVFTRKITRPIATYMAAWDKGGFKVVSSELHTKSLGEFFQDEDVSTFLNKSGLGVAKWQQDVLPIEFVDYTLKKA
jgi:hypothetical protein